MSAKLGTPRRGSREISENNLVNWNWRVVPYHVIPSWVKSFARSTWCLFTFMSRGKVAVAMALTLVSPFGTLNADTSCVFLFVCFVMWVSKSLKGINSIGCEIHFGCWLNPQRTVCIQAGRYPFPGTLTFKVKALIPTIATLWIIGVEIFTISHAYLARKRISPVKKCFLASCYIELAVLCNKKPTMKSTF